MFMIAFISSLTSIYLSDARTMTTSMDGLLLNLLERLVSAESVCFSSWQILFAYLPLTPAPLRAEIL